MFLTEDEIIELTNRRRRKSQSQVLNALGIQHKVRPDGTLLVLRSHVENELGGAEAAEAVKKKEKEPNWGALAHA